MVPTVVRPRLIDELTSSTAPIVTLVAAAGAGKSTLLHQVKESIDGGDGSPVVLVTCTEEDRCGARFAARVDRAISRVSSVRSSSGPFGEPRHVLFDDVHQLGRASGGLDVLAELVRAGAETGRIVLSSRARIPNLARLRAQGAVLDVDAQQLRFTPAECLAATGDRTGRYDGWPALVSIDSTAGPDAVKEYLAEQVIDPLSEPCRDVLMVAALLGAGDPASLSQAVGRTITADEFRQLAALPLVALGDDRFTVHPLYAELAATTLDPERRCRLAIGAAGPIMVSDPERAVELLLGSIDGADLSHAADIWSRLGYSDIPRRVLVGLAGAASSRAGGRTDPDVALLRGLLRRTADPMAIEAVEFLDRAAVGFADQGRWADVILARSEEGFAHRMGGRRREMQVALRQVVELADGLDSPGGRDIRARVMMAEAVLADEAGDDAEVLRRLELLEEQLLPHRYGGSVYLLAMLCSLQSGAGPEAVRFAEQFADIAPEDRRWARHLPSVAAWHSGLAPVVDQRLPGPEHYGAGNPIDRIWAASSLGLLAALRGDLAAAEVALSAAREACPDEVLARVRAIVASTEATVAVAAGREDDARRAIGDCLCRISAAGQLQPDPGRGLVRNFHWCLAILYVVRPELRTTIDGLALAPPLAAKRRAGQAMVALRSGDRIGIESGSAEDLRALAAALPVRWAATLVVGLHGRRSPVAASFTEAVIELYGTAARTLWWSFDDPISKKLAKTVPIDPGGSVEIKMLGPLRLIISGVETTGEHWSRDRVRALLALLAHHGSLRRDEVMLALWPDLDEDAGRRNLRVTLSHLRSLLEPERNTGEASFLVRAENDRIWLVDHRSVTTDVIRFDRLLDQAAELEAAGEAPAALECCWEAIDLWQGDYLCQYAYEDWPQIAANRLRARYVEACLNLGRHLAGVDRLQDAIRMAERALGAEPWSESAYALIIEAQVLGGNRAGAIRTMSAYQAVIGDLGVSPDPSMTALAAGLGLVDQAGRLVGGPTSKVPHPVPDVGPVGAGAGRP